MLQIIPVIDLKDGVVVHAMHGNRAQYQPIHLHSRLTQTSDIQSVVAGFLNLYPFKKFYLADINAICGKGHHQALIDNLVRTNPNIDFWLDNGSQLSTIDSSIANLKWVIGTESQQSPPFLSAQDFILSLDFNHQESTGLPEWFEQCQYWPNTLIAMTLNRVGSSIGPDFEKLKTLKRSHLEKDIVAAGGIRHWNDLIALSKIGIGTALLATALHTGTISRQNIENL